MPPTSPATAEQGARVLGWISGLGLLVVPVVVAGVLATAGGMVEELATPTDSGPERWQPERVFPWLHLGAGAAGLAWIAYGSVRIDGFRRGALPGTTVALVVLGGIYAAGFLSR